MIRFLPSAMMAAVLACGIAAGGPIDSVREIRGLSRSEAGEKRPVKLRGVVTMAFPWDDGSFIVDDGSFGIFVNRSRGEPADEGAKGRLEVGTLVEIEGVTTEAGFARDIVAGSIRRLGKAPLPEAKPATMDDLLGGHLDCQRVEVSGVVRFVERRASAPSLRLMLGTQGGRRLPVMLMNVSEEEARRMIDAEVTAEGVATSFFNERGELIGVTVQVDNAGGMRVTVPARDGKDIPLSGLAALSRFSPEKPSLQRVKVRGTVTFGRPGGFFYLQDEGRAVRVEPRDGSGPRPGDVVEVLGYPEVRSYFAELTGAEFRKVGEGEVPEPEDASREVILKRWLPVDSTGGIDGRRVKIRAELEKTETLPGNGRRLFLNHQGHTVFAELPAKLEGEADLQPRSVLDLTGICVVELNTGWPAVDWSVPGNFHLLVQSADEISVVRAAPWWTPARIWTALSVAAALAAAAAGWVIVLRRQVRSQTETIRMQSVRETLAEERSRMAREFHDTLEQELTGLSIQLDAASDSLPAQPEQAVGALESARTLLDYTRGEARRSIWDLRAMALEGGLFGALEWTAGQLRGPSTPEIRLSLSGVAKRLGSRVETHLLRIGTECLTNAVRHSGAALVMLELRYAESEVRLSVTDDGSGFVPPGPGAPVDGHFGLRGMRERAKQLGGEFSLESAPGSGTRIMVIIRHSEDG